MTLPPALPEFYARLTAAPPERRARRIEIVFAWLATLIACAFSVRFARTNSDGDKALIAAIVAVFSWKDYFGFRSEKRSSKILFRYWWLEWPGGMMTTWLVWKFRRVLISSFSVASFSSLHRRDLLEMGVLGLLAAVFLASLAWWWIQVIAELGWPVKPEVELVYPTEGVWPPPPKKPDETATYD